MTKRGIDFPVFLMWLLMALPLALTACSEDDVPADRSEEDILGLWQDKPGHILDMYDTDHLYDYTLVEVEGTKYWIKRKQTYFYEPRSELMMKDGVLDEETDEIPVHIYKIISINEEDMVMCWVDTPDLSNLEGENKLEVFKIFFNKDYKVDPALYETYRRLTPAGLNAALGDIEVIE